MLQITTVNSAGARVVKIKLQTIFFIHDIFVQGGYEPPDIILSDNGKEVTNKLKKSILIKYILLYNLFFDIEFTAMFGIHDIQGRSYHPQTRGQVETKNQTIKKAVCALSYLFFFIFLTIHISSSLNTFKKTHLTVEHSTCLS